MEGSTASISKAELAQRKLLFSGIIFAVFVVVVILGLLAAWYAKRRGREEFEEKEALTGNVGVFHAHGGSSDTPAVSKGEDQGDTAPASGEQAQSSGEPVRCDARRLLVAALFLSYIACCVLVPIWSFSSLSCSAGFYWETHMAFLALFAVTKVCELFFYMSPDPNLGPPLPLFSSGDTILGSLVRFQFTKGFLWKYIMSSLGYLDAYQDSTAIAIAFSCQDPLSHKLAWAMLLTYAFGVVVMQWAVAGSYALRRAPGACAMKLLHMDTVASRTSVTKDEGQHWRFLQGSRTLAEDIPQACLQLVYVVHVKHNPFMMFSIACAAGASLLALKEALQSALGSVSKEDRHVKTVYVASGWAIHGVVFESVTEKVWGRLLDNSCKDLDLFANWHKRGDQGLVTSFVMEDREFFVSVSGNSVRNGEYLCYELKFETSRGRMHTFTAGNEDWRGEPFDFQAPWGKAIDGLKFSGGTCVGIETSSAPAAAQTSAA